MDPSNAVDRSATDITEDWKRAVDAAIRSSSLTPEEQHRLKSSLVLKPVKRSRTPFLTTADAVLSAVQQLQEYITSIKRDYTGTGKLSNKEKDSIEEEVGATVKACGSQLEQLKGSVVAAQQQQQQQQGRQDGAGINEHTAAHLHGVVLVLVEQLQRVTAGFDRCRAVRYQQGLAWELATAARAPAQFTAAPPRSSWSGSQAPGSPSSQGRGGQQQQQQLQDKEVLQLMDELTKSSQQALEIERTVREITTLNQMISTAVMEQAEAIEQLYNNAVEATTNIQRGNKELRKTVALNRSSTLYLAVLMLTVTFIILFLHWFYS